MRNTESTDETFPPGRARSSPLSKSFLGNTKADAHIRNALVYKQLLYRLNTMCEECESSADPSSRDDTQVHGDPEFTILHNLVQTARADGFVPLRFLAAVDHAQMSSDPLTLLQSLLTALEVLERMDSAYKKFPWADLPRNLPEHYRIMRGKYVAAQTLEEDRELALFIQNQAFELLASDIVNSNFFTMSPFSLDCETNSPQKSHPESQLKSQHESNEEAAKSHCIRNDTFLAPRNFTRFANGLLGLEQIHDRAEAEAESRRAHDSDQENKHFPSFSFLDDPRKYRWMYDDATKRIANIETRFSKGCKLPSPTMLRGFLLAMHEMENFRIETCKSGMSVEEQKVFLMDALGLDELLKEESGGVGIAQFDMA